MSVVPLGPIRTWIVAASVSSRVLLIRHVFTIRLGAARRGARMSSSHVCSSGSVSGHHTTTASVAIRVVLYVLLHVPPRALIFCVHREALLTFLDAPRRAGEHPYPPLSRCRYSCWHPGRYGELALRRRSRQEKTPSRQRTCPALPGISLCRRATVTTSSSHALTRPGLSRPQASASRYDELITLRRRRRRRRHQPYLAIARASREPL